MVYYDYESELYPAFYHEPHDFDWGKAYLLSLPTDELKEKYREYTEMLENNEFDKPENYSYKNAIQQARYLLTKPAESGKNKGMSIVDVCTPQSILQSVMEMAQKGLNPDKKQLNA